MHPSLWSCPVNFQFLCGSTSNDQKTLKQETKDGGSDPKEQLDAPKEASNVAQEQSTTVVKTESSGNRKRRRSRRVKPESTDVGKAALPSPSQLEREIHDQKTDLADEMKLQTQMALGLLTFSAGAIISAKGTSFQRRQAGENLAAAGGQPVNLPGFWFWWSIGLWFIGLLFSTFTAMATSLQQQKSPGLLFYAKRINAFSLCVSVAGVAFWIIS